MEQNYTKIEHELPLIPLRGLAIFPYMILNFDVGREISLKALDAGALNDDIVLLTSQKEDETEAMLNVLCWVEGEKWMVAIFPRKQHRPSCYSAEGDANILISPASVDMGGVFITPLEKDFEKITSEDIQMILDEVCFSEEDAEKLINTIK